MLEDWASRWSDAAHLYHSLASRFPLQREMIKIAGHCFDFVSVANPHDQIDHLMGNVVDGDFQWEPFWAQAWPSASSLAAWMATDSGIDWKTQTVLDLGCGVGLSGCMAAALGSRVTFADYAEPAIEFAVLNAWPWRSQVTAYALDWHHDTLPTSFSLILGADIVYEQRNWDALDRFLKSHLAPGGMVLLTEPGRDTGHEVQSVMEQLGWQLQTAVLSVQANNRPLRLVIATLPNCRSKIVAPIVPNWR